MTKPKSANSNDQANPDSDHNTSKPQEPDNMNPEIRKLKEKDAETSRRVHILEAEVASIKEQLDLIKSYLDDIIDNPLP